MVSRAEKLNGNIKEELLILKDVEGMCRIIVGFSKNPEVDGEELKVDYDLKPMDLKWLQKLFNVDPNHIKASVRHLVEGQDFVLTKEKFETLKPYVIGGPPEFNDYNYFLDCGHASDWGYRGRTYFQIKNVLSKIEPLLKEKEEYYPHNIFIRGGQRSPAVLLDDKFWYEFHDYLWDNYPFTDLSIYRVDWETVKDFKRLSWPAIMESPEKLKEFLEDSYLSQFKEIAIAYGAWEPTILLSFDYFVRQPITELFNDNWGACFIVGVKRDKNGNVKLYYECFAEVDCGECLTVPI